MYRLINLLKLEEQGKQSLTNRTFELRKIIATVDFAISPNYLGYSFSLPMPGEMIVRESCLVTAKLHSQLHNVS